MGIDTILLRIDEVTKRSIEAAARLSGKSLTAFIVGAAKAQAIEIESPSDEDRGAALAAYYRARRFESLERQSWEHLHPGYVPIDTVARRLDWDIDDRDFLEEVDELVSGLDGLSSPEPPSSAAEPLSQANGAPALGVRRHDRRQVSQVYLFNPVPGRVVDLCASGLGVETRDALPLSKQDLFSIGDDAMVRAKIRGHVRWCRLARTESRANGDVISIYRSGVEFTEASP